MISAAQFREALSALIANVAVTTPTAEHNPLAAMRERALVKTKLEEAYLWWTEVERIESGKAR